MTTNETTQARITAMFDRKDVKSWRKTYVKTYGAPVVEEAHYPIGWLPLSYREDLYRMVAAGEVRIVEVARTSDPSKTAKFVARIGATS